MKKPKVKFVEVSDPEQIASLFEALGMEVPEELQQAMSADPKPEPEEDKPCGNPLCPCCCFKHDSPMENVSHVQQIMEMLTKDELVKSATLLFGIAAGAYMAAPFPHDQDIGAKIAAWQKLMRKSNPEFAFATTPHDTDKEGVAKH